MASAKQRKAHREAIKLASDLDLKLYGQKPIVLPTPPAPQKPAPIPTESKEK